MKRAASFPSASGNGRAHDKRGGRWRRQKQQQAGKLQKMGLAVKEFVEAAAGSQAAFPSSSEAPQRGPPAVSHRRRNRRELRREKRKMKRTRRRRRLLLDAEGEPAAAKGPRPSRPVSTPAAAREEEEEEKKPKPPKATKAGLKRPCAAKEKPPPPRLSIGEGRPPTTSPSRPSLAARKRALLEANEAEEREIRRLERQLGLHKRRRRLRPGGEGGGEAAPAEAVPQSFVRDGLGYVLGALGSGWATFSGLYESSEEEEGHGGKDEEGGHRSLAEEEEDDDEEGSVWGEEEGGDSSVEGDIGSDAQDAPHSCRSSGDEEAAGDPPPPPPAAPPRSEEENLSQSASKYIPPQMRQSEEIDAKKREELERLNKTVKGLINRLSEQNLASISGQLEELYMANSRKDMNETLTSIVISACVTSSAMPPRLVMEHVLLISVLHQTVGIEVGAHFLETVVRKFDEIYKSEAEGKECENLLTLIAHLYNFHVMHSLLIFDILKKLVSTFSAKDIELILLLLKNVGFSLRKDDALALKELITEAQKKANTEGKQFQDQTRVCFMLEIMLALKNNDMRKIPGYDPEPVEKLRKLMRTLVHGASSGKDAQLRVSLKSLLSADQVGRWWIVGSSWSGTPMIGSASNKIQQILSAGKVSSEILELARKQRMNTDIRRNIFCILMTCEDFLDAFEKLLKLGLKDQQEREIVHVLIDCCLQEKTYNPFYAYLSAKFCEYERRFQMTFQFSMWDKIKDLENLSASASSNLVRLLVHLLKNKSLSLTVFKVIEFSELDKLKVHFLRQVLSALLIQTDPEELNHIFGKLADNPKLGMLLESLKLFLTHFLLKNTRAFKSDEEATLLKEKIELVTKALKSKESRLKL